MRINRFRPAQIALLGATLLLGNQTTHATLLGFNFDALLNQGAFIPGVGTLPAGAPLSGSFAYEGTPGPYELSNTSFFPGVVQSTHADLLPFDGVHDWSYTFNGVTRNSTEAHAGAEFGDFVLEVTDDTGLGDSDRFEFESRSRLPSSPLETFSRYTRDRSGR